MGAVQDACERFAIFLIDNELKTIFSRLPPNSAVFHEARQLNKGLQFKTLLIRAKVSHDASKSSKALSGVCYLRTIEKQLVTHCSIPTKG